MALARASLSADDLRLCVPWYDADGAVRLDLMELLLTSESPRDKVERAGLAKVALESISGVRSGRVANGPRLPVATTLA